MILTWEMDPVLLHLGGLELRWYGLLFAAGFFLGTLVLKQVFLAEKKPLADLDPLLGYMVVGVVVGARLGHCLFYEPQYYLAHPWEIPMVWHGGLASHGAVLGMFVSLWWFAKKRGYPYLWLLDRIALLVPLAGALIRVGNFFNSEILGQPTGGNFGVIFANVDRVPRHPAQLYEALCYLALFFFEWIWYRRQQKKKFAGTILGQMLTGIFLARFALEGLKEVQVPFESGWWLNLGQLLSLPFLVLGLWLLLKKGKTSP